MKVGGGVFCLCEVFIIIHFVKHAGAACTFPDPLRGNWISSEKGTLNFTNNTLWNYPIALTATVTSATFTCESTYNGLYFLKATTSVELFNVNFSAYLCVNFTQISATKYIYSIECANETGLLTPSRVYVRTALTTVTAATACNRESPTDKSDFSVLVKEVQPLVRLLVEKCDTAGSRKCGSSGSRKCDSSGSGKVTFTSAVSSLQAIATCPNDFLATFSNFTVTGYSGANQCTGNSLDVCTDRTAMKYTYKSCSSSVKFSSGGYFYCLYYQTNSSTGVTYLHVYNNDSTVVSGSTYRIVCYAFKKSGDTIFTTEYPGSCHGNQNDTYVKSPGLITEYFNVTKTCVIVVGSEIQDWKYIIAICCGFVGLIILTVVIVIVIKTRLCCRCYASLCKRCAHGVKVTQSQGDMEEQELPVVQSDIVTAKQKNRFIKPNPERGKSFAKEDETTTVGSEVALHMKDEGNETVTIKEPSKFVPRKPRKIKNVTFIIKSNRHIETLLHIPFMPELLYQVVPRPTSSRRMFYRTPTFMSEKSLDKIDLVSQNQQEKSRRQL